MTITTDTHEAEYCELSGRPGMEALTRECHCTGVRAKYGVDWYKESSGKNQGCSDCGNTGSLPLPEAERMGALVEQVLTKGGHCSFHKHHKVQGPAAIAVVLTFRGSGNVRHGPTPEAALTRALLAATE